MHPDENLHIITPTSGKVFHIHSAPGVVSRYRAVFDDVNEIIELHGAHKDVSYPDVDEGYVEYTTYGQIEVMTYFK
jgi:hypothetical protein